METFRSIQYEVLDGVIHLRVPGRDFVMEQAQDIVEVIFEQLDDGPQDVILELTPVAYINSSGISVVIRMNLERNLRLVSPSPMVSDILELTGVLPFVPKFDTVEEAVASLE
ncbi:MAG: STAS domain-containing protein [Planctomycetota bacterium]